MPTVGTSGKTIPVDRTGKAVAAQRITKEQIYDETIERLNKDGFTVAEGDAFEAAEAKRITGLRAEEARYKARLKEVAMFYDATLRTLSFKGKLVFKGVANAKTTILVSGDVYMTIICLL